MTTARLVQWWGVLVRLPQIPHSQKLSEISWWSNLFYRRMRKFTICFGEVCSSPFSPPWIRPRRIHGRGMEASASSQKLFGPTRGSHAPSSRRTKSGVIFTPIPGMICLLSDAKGCAVMLLFNLNQTTCFLMNLRSNIYSTKITHNQPLCLFVILYSLFKRTMNCSVT